MTEVLAVIQDLGSQDVEGLPVARSLADAGTRGSTVTGIDNIYAESGNTVDVPTVALKS